MRTIKFRAWDATRSKMHYEDAFVRASFNPIRITIKKSSLVLDTIMQFTGLTDKNGTEIYEGDKVKSTHPNCYLGDMNDIYEVVYSQKYCMFCLKCIASDNQNRIGKIASKGSGNPYMIQASKTEIIGNIHEKHS